MKRFGFLLLGFCLTAGVVGTLGCGDGEAETPAVETETEDATTPAEEAAEEATEEATE